MVHSFAAPKLYDAARVGNGMTGEVPVTRGLDT